MYTVLRQTTRKRLQAKLNEVKAELQRRMHTPIPELGKWLQAVVRGHIRYYGVPMNQPALFLFRFQVGRLWHRALSRRSHKGRVLWDRMRRLITRWLPPPTVCHPHPLRAWASSPKARAGCGNSACPDPWRGLCANMIPTPTVVAQ